MATEEDEFWEDGKCSGTMYCGDHDHYAFLKEAFGLFAHENALQRDMCPSATRFEGEIIAMALDLMHAEAVDDSDPAGMVTTRRQRQHRAGRARLPRAGAGGPRHRRGPNLVKPETGHPAFDKACHMFGVEMRTGPVDPETTLVEPDGCAEPIDEQTDRDRRARPATTATARSTRSRSCRTLALERGVGLHVDGCLGGYFLPFGEELGYRSRPSTSGSPA